MKKKSKEKKQKPVFVDDGRTIANMDYENITGYKSKEERKKHEEIRSLNLTKKERRALYRGVLSQFVTYLLFFVFVYVLLLVIFYFFMR